MNVGSLPVEVYSSRVESCMSRALARCLLSSCCRVVTILLYAGLVYVAVDGAMRIEVDIGIERLISDDEPSLSFLEAQNKLF